MEDRTLPAVIGNGTGLLGQYYSDQTFTHLQTSRVDSSVNFNWKGSAPAAGVPATHFSVRWTGQIETEVTGSQGIYIHADDGVKVILNGQTIINSPGDNGFRELRAFVNLTAGQKYNIEIDYTENTNPAQLQLYWAGANILPWAVIPTSQLFPPAATAPPAAAPVVTPPAAPTTSLAAANVTTAGASTYTFSVTYTDSLALNTASLDSKDIVVTGPKGFSQAATFTGYTTKGNTWTATYRINAPGGSWDTSDNGAYTVTLQGSQVGDASRYVVGGSLGTFNVTLLGSSDWFSQHLTDTRLTSLTRTLDSDGSISRNDMIALFRQAEADGTVSAAEMADLKTVVANASFLNMTDTVHNLANKVVNGDLANQTYQGQTLGNLTVSSTGQQLEKLVDKWFLGMDHPALAPSTTAITYVLANGTLFGAGGPTYNDIKQGELNDCYFDAALSEVVFRSPQSITSMFTDNGDGTYTVRFYNNGVSDYVTVDKYLASYGGGRFWYDNLGNTMSSSTNVLWAGLLEKAYAQLAESGWSRGTGLGNAYHSMENGWEGSVIQQITGKTVTSDWVANSAAGLSAIVSAYQAGKMVSIDSKPTTASPIISNHVYVVVGYNATTKTFDLWNVWGYHQSVTWAQIVANFDTWSQSV